VLKYLIAYEASGRGGEISTAAVELIVEGREHRFATLSFAQSEQRSDILQSMISTKGRPMTDDHGRTYICQKIYGLREIMSSFVEPLCFLRLYLIFLDPQ